MPSSKKTPPAAPKPKRSTLGWVTLNVARITAIFFMILGWIAVPTVLYWFATPVADNVYTGRQCAIEHNVVRIPIRGELINDYLTKPVSQEFDDLLAALDADWTVDAVILDIDSPGGEVYVAEAMARSTAQFSKPIYSVIRSQGMSAAYWIAAASDKIFALASSQVGSIGVSSSYVDESIKNDNDGLTFNQLSTGEFKDVGHPAKPLTAAERDLIQQELDTLHDLFVNDIAKHRDLELSAVQALADGSILLGQEARDVGLIDILGDMSTAVDTMARDLNTRLDICDIPLYALPVNAVIEEL